jgi:hypothetical protein
VKAHRAQAIFVSLLCLACSKPGDDSEAKRSPIPEPPPGATVPKDLSVPVESAGEVVYTLTTAILEERKPDFKDEERQAWRLDLLLGEKLFPKGSLLEAEGADGVGISMHRPEKEDDPLPVVVLTRRSEVVAAIVKASNPFPDYHGQGGRLHRPGDPMPRLLTPVVKLRVLLGTASAPESSPNVGNLRLQIGDNPPNKISAKLIASLPSSKVMGDSGGERTRWNLRDLVKAAGGEKAALTKVVGDGEVEISAEQWADAKLRPVLQENRRGELKFHWLDKKSNALEEGSIRAVELLQMKR